MPSLESTFLDAIREATVEKQAESRLTFADWLEEHGDPRSNLLRKEVMAAEILGRENVPGIPDGQAFFGQIEPEILQQLAKAPFPTTEILEACCDHLLVLCPGYSLIEICRHVDRLEEIKSKRKEKTARLL